MDIQLVLDTLTSGLLLVPGAVFVCLIVILLRKINKK